MSTSADRSVSVVKPGQRHAAATIAAGHAEYPAFRHVFPDPRRRPRALRPFLTATVRDAIPFVVVGRRRWGPGCG